jgi:GABA(A) receptor-associated protein
VNNIIQRRLELNKVEALYLFMGDTLLQPFQKIGQVYDEFKDEDGFLHIFFYEYNTFGTN